MRDPHRFNVARMLRWSAVACSLFLFFWVRPRVGRLAARSDFSFAAVARYALAIMLALGVSEIALRKPWAHNPPPLGGCPWCPPTIFNPHYLWELRPSNDFTFNVGDHEITYSVDAEGCRARSSDVHRDHDRPTIFIGGESVALGMGLPYEQTYAALLEDRTGLQVVDLAAHGYGMDQIYMREADVIAKYTKPIAIVTLFIPEVAERSDVEDRIRLQVGPSGSLEEVPPTPEWIRQIRLRALWRSMYHNDKELTAMQAIARATADLAHSRGAYPLFVTTNYGERCLDVSGQSPTIYRMLFDEQNVPRIHVDLPLSQRVPDLHPGPLSHRQLADAIERALHDAHVL